MSLLIYSINWKKWEFSVFFFPPLVQLFPDFGLWFGTAHWRWDDRLRGHSLVPRAGDHVELDALQCDRWLMQTFYLWPFHPHISIIVVNLCPASLFSGYLVSGVYNGWTSYRKNSVSRYWPYPFQWYNYCERWAAADTICIAHLTGSMHGDIGEVGEGVIDLFFHLKLICTRVLQQVGSQWGNLVISVYWIWAKSIISAPLLKNKSKL